MNDYYGDFRSKIILESNDDQELFLNVFVLERPNKVEL